MNPESELLMSLHFWCLPPEPKHRHLSKSTATLTHVINYHIESQSLVIYVLTMYVCGRSIHHDVEM